MWRTFEAGPWNGVCSTTLSIRLQRNQTETGPSARAGVQTTRSRSEFLGGSQLAQRLRFSLVSVSSCELWVNVLKFNFRHHEYLCLFVLLSKTVRHNNTLPLNILSLSTTSGIITIPTPSCPHLSVAGVILYLHFLWSLVQEANYKQDDSSAFSWISLIRCKLVIIDHCSDAQQMIAK